MGYEFKSGYLLHKNDPLEEIINRNQELLEKKFQLGPKFDADKEIQILFETDLFDEMRLFWFYTDNYFCLSLLVPEDNMIDDSNQFIEKKLNAIIKLSKNLWGTGLIGIVKTLPEIGGFLSLKTIDTGAVPSIEPFCIVCNSIFSKFYNKLTDNNNIENNSFNSTLIFNQTFVLQKSIVNRII